MWPGRVHPRRRRARVVPVRVRRRLAAGAAQGVRACFSFKNLARFLWCAGSSPWRVVAVCGWRMRARVGDLVPS